METNSTDDDRLPPDMHRVKGVSPPQRRVLNSDDLLCGEKEVLINHHGEIYRLRETRNGKLILGK